MKKTKTFKVARGLFGGTKKIDETTAALEEQGWTIKDIKQPTTLNPNFYIVAEWDGPDKPPKLKRKGVHPALGALIFFALLVIIIIAVTSDREKGGRPDEESIEYQQAVHEQMKFLAEDPDIESIRVEGSLLYVNFNKAQPKSEYLAVARGNAARFSKFKKEKLGASNVTVYCFYDGNIYAEADARDGRVTSAK